MMPIKNAQGDIEANLFYVSYVLDGTTDYSKRPLMVAFNGAARGSASVWLHTLGCIGPKRVKMMDDGALPAAPYQLVDNDNTWLDQTDLVFVDPVGTGYSRAQNQALQHKFNSLEGDVQSVGEFIRLFLTRNERWASPLFLAGESYGTTRAAGLSGYLVDNGIAFNGVILLSTVLNFETILFSHGNDLPYMLYLPSYTATAFYHKKLPPELQKSLEVTLKEAERLAVGAYNEALAKGDQLTDADYKSIVAKVARLTGIDQKYVDNSDLRMELMHYLRELLRDQKLMAGRLDSRLTGPAPLNTSEMAEFDPSMTAIRPPYTAMFQSVRACGAGIQNGHDAYYVLGGGILGWDYGEQNKNRYVDVSDSLRSAFAKNPHMKVFVGCGYYDMATPYLPRPESIRVQPHGSASQRAQECCVSVLHGGAHVLYRRAVAQEVEERYHSVHKVVELTLRAASTLVSMHGNFFMASKASIEMSLDAARTSAYATSAQQRKRDKLGTRFV